MSEKDFTVIPFGCYCYDVIGYEDYKQKVKMCPYYEKGKMYATCEYLGEIKFDHLLEDKIKICGVNEIK